MDVPVGDGGGLLADLIRRAETGEDIVLTRDGRPVARLVAVVGKATTVAERRAVLDAIRAAAKGRVNEEPSAERSQDFLYDEYGLPE